jgi:hypothetical protein
MEGGADCPPRSRCRSPRRGARARSVGIACQWSGHAQELFAWWIAAVDASESPRSIPNRALQTRPARAWENRQSRTEPGSRSSRRSGRDHGRCECRAETRAESRKSRGAVPEAGDGAAGARVGCAEPEEEGEAEAVEAREGRRRGSARGSTRRRKRARRRPSPSGGRPPSSRRSRTRTDCGTSPATASAARPGPPARASRS